jgi:hypothetical protein
MEVANIQVHHHLEGEEEQQQVDQLQIDLGCI